MQTNTEAKQVALQHISEVKQQLVEFVSLFSDHLELAYVTIQQWHVEINKVLRVYEEYIQSAPEDELFGRFNDVCNVIKHALVPRDKNNVAQYEDAIKAYEFLVRMVLVETPQAFFTSDNVSEEIELS